MPNPRGGPPRKNIAAKRVHFSKEVTPTRIPRGILGNEGHRHLDNMINADSKRFRPNNDVGQQIVATVKALRIEFEFIELQHEMAQLRIMTQEISNLQQELQQRLDQSLGLGRTMDSVNQQNKQYFQSIRQHQIDITRYTNSMEDITMEIQKRYDAIERIVNERICEIKTKLENVTVQRTQKEKETERLAEQARNDDAKLLDIAKRDNELEQEMERIKNEVEEVEEAEKTAQKALDEQDNKADEFAEMEEQILQRSKTIENEFAGKLEEKASYRNMLSQTRDEEFKKYKQSLGIQTEFNRKIKEEIQKLREQQTAKENPDSSNEKLIAPSNLRSGSSSSCSIVESSNCGTQPPLFRKTELKCSSPSAVDQGRNKGEERPHTGSEEDTDSIIPNTPGNQRAASTKLNSPYSVPDSSVGGSVRFRHLSDSSSNQRQRSIIDRKYFQCLPNQFGDSFSENSDMDED